MSNDDYWCHDYWYDDCCSDDYWCDDYYSNENEYKEKNKIIFCNSCYLIFENKSNCLKHEKICSKDT